MIDWNAIATAAVLALGTALVVAFRKLMARWLKSAWHQLKPPPLPPPPPPPPPKHNIRYRRFRLPVAESVPLGDKPHVRAWHSFYLDYKEGPDFRIERCTMVVLKREKPGERKEDAPPNALHVGYVMLSATPLGERPVFKAGDTQYFAAGLEKPQFDWENVDADNPQFAVLVLWSQGEPVWTTDVSEDIRAALPVLLGWRKTGPPQSGCMPEVIEAMLKMEIGESNVRMMIP